MRSPVIIVRYFLGSSGRFMCALLSSLIEPVELAESHRAHLNMDHDKYHNYNQRDRDLSIYDTFTNDIFQSEESIERGAEYFRREIKFGPEFRTGPEPLMYIISCHAYTPEPMLRGIENSRVLNITFQPDDIDQITYNWVTKNIVQDRRYDDLLNLIKFLKHSWPRELKPVRESDVDFNDVRKMCFIVKWLNQSAMERFNSVSQKIANKSLNIKFSQIGDEQIIDSIIDFCGIDVPEDRLNNAKRLISQYASAQTPVPWSLDIVDGQALGF